ncbi:hypothetical protein HOLleu_36091 [Holothuria leucospilota]|uniref:Uncharacterized protein n=1 Tax=Holothuria leucospilota TaxID=206669 RepID=A0A9Q0YJ86_HOLLE|nr:hypothetical protein HOLleu_36091 [Holothuria leucospilota]
MGILLIVCGVIGFAVGVVAICLPVGTYFDRFDFVGWGIEWNCKWNRPHSENCENHEHKLIPLLTNGPTKNSHPPNEENTCFVHIFAWCHSSH